MSKLYVNELVPRDASVITAPNLQLPAGSVIQVVNSKYNATVSTTSTSFTDTGLTATITPRYSNSKILVTVCQNGFQKSASNTYSKVILLRNSTELTIISTPIGYDNTANTQVSGSLSTTYLDSPATTSAITYKVQFNNSPGTGTVIMQTATGGVTESTITLMEIAQ